jgi:RecB family exonuclease
MSEAEYIDATEEDESPFIPGTNIQFAWDSTSLEYLKRCPRLYYYKMIAGYTSNEEDVNLRFGGEFHQAMHEYQLMIADEIEHDEALFLTVKELLLRTDDWRPESKYKNREFLVRSVIRYLDKYRDDPCKTVIRPDGQPAVELSFRLELEYGPAEGQPYLLCGHIDRVVEHNGTEFFMDYKTTTTTPSDWYWGQFHPHNQMTLYTFASSVIFDTPIKGGIVRSGQIMMEDTRFTEGMTYRTEGEIEEWLFDLQHWLAMAKSYAQNNYWPMNDTACDKYGGCKFRDICSKSPSVREKFIKADFKEQPIWNPLRTR